jgi:hypothetical protein
MVDKEKSIQERLMDHVEKLETHNSSHGKNVVFWSCKQCYPEEGMSYHLFSDCLGTCLESLKEE